jgi:hypothetical protein
MRIISERATSASRRRYANPAARVNDISVFFRNMPKGGSHYGKEESSQEVRQEKQEEIGRRAFNS